MLEYWSPEHPVKLETSNNFSRCFRSLLKNQKKLYQHRPQIAKPYFCVINVEKKMPPTIAHYNGTLIWHPASTPPKLVVTLPPNHSTLQWHPAMAPRPLPSGTGTQQWHPGTQQWHPAPSNGTTSTPLWHPAMAPSNGTTSTPPKLVITLPPNHITLQWHPTKAPSNGTTSSAPCNGTLVPRPIRQSGSSPSPPIGSKNPYSYRYLGKNTFVTFTIIFVEKKT